MSLKGKVAIVTGGTGALGSVIAGRFLSEGIAVTASFIHEKETENVPESVRNKINLVKADVTVESSVENLFESVVHKFGPVHIVVNTVGGFLPRKPLAEIAVEEWQRMMNINLMSSFLCTREAIRRMKNQPYGRIVNISAMVGLNPSGGRAAYAISKAGVSLLTDIVAQEIKGSGITINAIAPSIIDTPANRSSMPKQDFQKWVKPEEIADTICYLCSDRAGAISGTTIKAFGGL